MTTPTTWADVAMALVQNAPGIATALGVLVTAITGVISAIVGVLNHAKIKEGNELTAVGNADAVVIKKQTNGLMAALVKDEQEKSHAKGVSDEQARVAALPEWRLEEIRGESI